MAEVNWTAEAERWLRDIYQYIAEDSPAAADRVVHGLLDRARLLAQFPKVGQRYSEDPDSDVRVLLYGHYRIAYRIRPNGDVDILGVFHGALDIGEYQF